MTKKKRKKRKKQEKARTWREKRRAADLHKSLDAAYRDRLAREP